MTVAELERFRKILGLLGSEHEGERSAAALKATAWLKEHGLTWADVTLAGTIEAEESELAQRRSDIMRAAGEARETVRRRNRERWAQTAAQPDANGFFDDLRSDIRQATGGEDGQRDPRMRKTAP